MTSGFATVKGVTSGDTLLLVGRAAAAGLQPTLTASPRRAGQGLERRRRPFAWAARDFLRARAGQGRELPRRRRGRGPVVRRRVAQDRRGRRVAGAPARAGGWCRARAPARRRRRRRGARAASRRARGPARTRARPPARRGASTDGLRRAARGRRGARSSSTCAAGRTCDASCTAAPRTRRTPTWRSSACASRASAVAACPSRRRAAAAGRRAAGAAGEAVRAPGQRFVEARLLHLEVVVRFAAAADGAPGGAVGDVAHAASGQRVGVALLREGLAKLDERWRCWATPRSGDAPRRGRRAATAAALARVREAEPGRRRRGRLRGRRRGHVGRHARGGRGRRRAPRLALVVPRAAAGPRQERPRRRTVGRREPRGAAPRGRRAPRPPSSTVRRARRRRRRRRADGRAARPRGVPSCPTRGRAAGAVPEDKQRDVAKALADLGLVSVGRRGPERGPRRALRRARRAEQRAAREEAAAPRAAPPPGPRVADLVGDARRARTFLPALQRAATVRATVEAVFSGSRVKLRAGRGHARSSGLRVRPRARRRRAPVRRRAAAGPGVRAPAPPAARRRRARARHGPPASRSARAPPEDAKRRGTPAPRARRPSPPPTTRSRAGSSRAASAASTRGAAPAPPGPWARSGGRRPPGSASGRTRRPPRPRRPRPHPPRARRRLARPRGRGRRRRPLVHADPPAKLDAVLAAMRAFAPPATAAAAAHRRNAVSPRGPTTARASGGTRARRRGRPGRRDAHAPLPRLRQPRGRRAGRPRRALGAGAALPPAAVECRLARVPPPPSTTRPARRARALHELVWGKGPARRVPAAPAARARVRVVDGVLEARPAATRGRPSTSGNGTRPRARAAPQARRRRRRSPCGRSSRARAPPPASALRRPTPTTGRHRGPLFPSSLALSGRP